MTEVILERHFTQPRQGADTLSRRTLDVRIVDDEGKHIFSQPNVTIPEGWSENAATIVASKYFRGGLDSPSRESSVFGMVDRVVNQITAWGEAGGYFNLHEGESSIFADELKYLLLNQCASFNSPVWFNVGIESKPQCSACFINSVEDTMESIMDLATREALLFKWGSGTGSNLSNIRSSKAKLHGGGTASGPVSFMRGYDAFAGVVKSGGKTRRAAKMICLNADHPDIMEFIKSKASEERKAWDLVEMGYDGSLNGEAYSTVAFQNANHSVRVSDEFMRVLEEGGQFGLVERNTGEIVETVSAQEVMDAMVKSAHQCGDPGIQFHDTINVWHTCPEGGSINASNPCSEFMFLDDTACNLSSINLRKFQGEDGAFMHEDFVQACRVMITAQEILVSNSSYPSEDIAVNSENYRPLGLGYTNLGGFLMSAGIAYGSDEATFVTAMITSLMTSSAYHQSARLASVAGSFKGYEKNEKHMSRVLFRHAESLVGFCSDSTDERFSGLYEVASDSWKDVMGPYSKHGFRNSQVTVLAPTGTISFMMDCATTGIEPALGLSTVKQLSGGGSISQENTLIRNALESLGYSEGDIASVVSHISAGGNIETSTSLKPEHLPVFDCALKHPNGTRFISAYDHMRMMAAAQPFLSGAISKTVNVPESTTPDEINDIYVQAWKFGLKSIAIYRDNSKRSQPLSTGGDKVSLNPQETLDGPPEYQRNRLPSTRAAKNHKFSIGNTEGYLTVGEYDNGKPGEVFLIVSKEGTVASGMADAVGTLTSIALQSGVPIKTLVDKFSHTRFEPSGWTNNPDIPYAESILDYIFRWIGQEYPDLGGDVETNSDAEPETDVGVRAEANSSTESGETCSVCGGMMLRSGSCSTCPRCGETSGCG